ncbi:MAG: exopolysaccharide biosynthesis protein [bacterium]
MKGLSNEEDKKAHICLSQAELEELRTDSLGEKLRIVIEKLPPSQVTMDEMTILVGQDGLLLLAILLSLVFLAPVQIPGLGGVFGFAIILIAISRLKGRTLWLPKRIAQCAMSSEKVREALAKSSGWLRRLEYVSRPHRLNRLAASRLADLVNNGAIIYGAILLILPIILVPFSNTLPALAVLFLCIGLLQRDGLCILYGHLFNMATTVYFTALVIGGHEAFEKLLHFFD